MRKLNFFLILLLTATSACAQRLHQLESAKNHYENFQILDARPSADRASLDTIQYPINLEERARQFLGLEPTYLTQGNVDFLKESVHYPANSSDQTRAELDFLLEWEKKRTKANEDRAMEIARIGYWPPFEKDDPEYGSKYEDLFWEGRTVLGEDCTSEKYPATLHLLAGVTRDMRIIEFTVKYHLMRARPYHLEPKLNPMARISSPSFASGHTLWAYIQAFTWSELVPKKRKEFLAVAYEVGESREIMGIHYPSDEEAARQLAHQMLEFMWQNPVFIQDLKAAKAEWR